MASLNSSIGSTNATVASNNTALANSISTNVATLNTKFNDYYTAIISDGKYQLKLSASTPLSLANNILSIDLSNYSTLANLSTAVANLVNSAPATLDTLKELAVALNNDPNFATTITTLIGTKQAQITATLPFNSDLKYLIN